MADKALLTGINNYENISDLAGCLSDVANMKSLLIESFGFQPENIRELPDEEVTYDNIKDGFDWLFEDVEDGDRLVFHFSGHGSYRPSDNEDEPVDELLCLYSMDWDDEDSFIVDDDLGKLLDKKPDGADMTVILDCCHSGSGTKAVTGQGRSTKSITQRSKLVIVSDAIESGVRGMTRDFDLENDDIDLENSNPPIARFVRPPAKIQKAVEERLGKSGARIRSIGKNARSVDVWNHQLIAGAMDSQTAADAFIDLKYQGAFTYNLCKAYRNHGNVSVSSLIAEIRNELRRGGYSQIPQLEGKRQNEKLLGGAAVSSISEKEPTFEAGFLPAVQVSETAESNGNMDAFCQLIRTQEKFLDLGTKLLTQESGGGSSGFEVLSGGSSGAGPDSRGAEHIIYVHGISQHREGYSDSWFRAMRPFLSRSIPKSEVLWSDIVNPRSVVGGSMREIAERQTLLREIEQEINFRQRQDAELADESTRSMDRSLFGSGFMIDDFLRYMTSTTTRNQILARFDNVVRPLLENGKTLHIISHSWGTVVAFEGLKRLGNTSVSGTVRNLFTVGSALSIGTVRRNLFDRVGNGRKPKHVQRIFNLDAGGDAVGGSIAEHFEIDSEYVGLDPVGCRKIPFTAIAMSLSCAHSSYFSPNNTLVNRNIFGRKING